MLDTPGLVLDTPDLVLGTPGLVPLNVYRFRSNNTPVQAWASANPSNPQHQTHLENGNTEDGKWGDGDISEPVMKDQTTVRVLLCTLVYSTVL